MDAEREARRRTFFRVRVGILLFVLFVVVLWAIRDVRSRRERTSWERTLDVAVILVHVEGTLGPEPAAVEAMRARAEALEARLERELSRYRPGVVKPFRFRILGPVDVAAPAPLPLEDGLIDLAKHAWAVRQWTADVDPRVPVVPEHYDTRIYVTVRKATSNESAFVEGHSEQGGRLGFVDVDLDEAMADLALFVVAHELLHTLGATDKYDAAGRARFPDGFVDPSATPLYPQRGAEVMARNRPLAPGVERVPDTLDELGIGPATAAEIRAADGDSQ